MDNQDTGATPVATEEPRALVSPEIEQEPAESAPAEQPETTAEPGTADPDAPEAGAGDAKEDAPPAQEPRFKRRAKERIQELAAKAREKEQEAAYWRQMALQHQQPQQSAQPKAPDFDPTPFIGPAPTPASFAAGEYDPAYIEERAVYRLRAEQAKAQMAQRQQQTAAQEAEMMQRGRARIEQETARLPDLPDAVAYLGSTLSVPVANVVADLIANSDHGADVALELASDDARLGRIASMPPHRAAIEIGKLEAKIEARKQAAVISKAPPPPPTVTGAAAPPRKEFSQMNDSEAAAFMQRILARR